MKEKESSAGHLKLIANQCSSCHEVLEVNVANWLMSHLPWKPMDETSAGLQYCYYCMDT